MSTGLEYERTGRRREELRVVFRSVHIPLGPSSEKAHTAMTTIYLFATLQSCWKTRVWQCAAVTVAKTWNYPEQDTAIRTIAGKQPWAVTIGDRQKLASQDNNRSFPERVEQAGSLSAATATPSLRQYMTQA